MPISISSIFTPTVSVNPSGMATYSVQVKDANGCVSFANTATVDVKACTGIDKHNFETGFTLFPNPSMGTVFLQSKTTTKVTIELIDFSGKLLLKQLKVDLRSDEPYKIHLETIKKGIYFIRLFSDNVSTIHLKLVRD